MVKTTYMAWYLPSDLSHILCHVHLTPVPQALYLFLKYAGFFLHQGHCFCCSLWLENSSSRYSYAWLLPITPVSKGSLSHPRRALVHVCISYSLEHFFPVWNVHSFTGLLVHFCLLLLEYKLHESRNVYGLSQYPTHSKKILRYIRDPISIC